MAKPFVALRVGVFSTGSCLVRQAASLLLSPPDDGAPQHFTSDDYDAVVETTRGDSLVISQNEQACAVIDLFDLVNCDAFIIAMNCPDENPHAAAILSCLARLPQQTVVALVPQKRVDASDTDPYMRFAETASLPFFNILLSEPEEYRRLLKRLCAKIISHQQ